MPIFQTNKPSFVFVVFPIRELKTKTGLSLTLIVLILGTKPVWLALSPCVIYTFQRQVMDYVLSILENRDKPFQCERGCDLLRHLILKGNSFKIQLLTISKNLQTSAKQNTFFVTQLIQG
eukprot:GAHX01001875.1.p2 GENE.GAHX01001875.1~~GAHX01001875.1.p2  ORF type:complete len:120 (+),score=10.08 GAHX01001875.1:261-620(+)